MSKISDESISAWLDREGSVEQSVQIESAIAADPALALRVARLARVDRLLAPAFAETLNAPMPERLERLLARPRGSAKLRGLWSGFATMLTPGPLLAVGASMAVAAVAGGALLSGLGASPGFETTPDGDIIANSQLSTRLAKVASGDDGAVRVKLSLRDGAGRFCRQFETSAAAGLACFDAGNWRVESLTGGHKPSSSQGDYVMAGRGADPGTAAALERIGVTELLDRGQEARAIATGWK